MKFGKVQDISLVDFSFPNEPKRNELILSDLPTRPHPPRIYLGATGWSMKEWNGKWYPEKTSSKSFLQEYGKQFNGIELNTTHYRIPRADLIQKWYDETPSDFKFSPKIPQSISHSRDMGIFGEKLPIFFREIKGLKEKLGCCFMQMPPYFNPERLPQLERFLGEWDAEIPLAIEVRHEDWFNNIENSEVLFLLLEKYNISTVITDVAGRRDVFHNRLTNDIVMVRFVGNGLHPTDYERADNWVQQIKKWFAQNVKEVYFFPHQPDNILTPEMSVYLLEEFKKHIPKIEVRGPKNLEDTGQMMLF